MPVCVLPVMANGSCEITDGRGQACLADCCTGTSKKTRTSGVAGLDECNISSPDQVRSTLTVSAEVVCKHYQLS